MYVVFAILVRMVFSGHLEFNDTCHLDAAVAPLGTQELSLLQTRKVRQHRNIILYVTVGMNVLLDYSQTSHKQTLAGPTLGICLWGGCSNIGPTNVLSTYNRCPHTSARRRSTVLQMQWRGFCPLEYLAL